MSRPSTPPTPTPTDRLFSAVLENKREDVVVTIRDLADINGVNADGYSVFEVAGMESARREQESRESGVENPRVTSILCLLALHGARGREQTEKERQALLRRQEELRTRERTFKTTPG